MEPEVVRPVAATRVKTERHLPRGETIVLTESEDFDFFELVGRAMKQFILTTGCMLAVSLSFFAQSADAQTCSSCEGAVVEGGIVEGGYGEISPGVPCEGCHVAAKARRIVSSAAGLILGPETGTVSDGEGMVQPQAKCLHPKQTLTNAARDAFSPNPIYAYSNPGLRAGRTHSWNQDQANVYSWHGGYNSWRFGQPTAVVVPPTASYQSTYAWGVGQTRSTPIHHQFGRGAGSSGGVGGGFQNTPYWPYSTNNFGYYPVRASW